MSIKYAEITIIRNIEEENIFRGIIRYFGYENITNDKDTIIIVFDDGTMYDIKDEYENKDFKFAVTGYNHNFPIYFEIRDKKTTLFYKSPKYVDDKKKLDFNPIFKGCKNYDKNQVIASIYNIIYEDIHKKDQFGIVRLKSNEEKPRYKLAYNDSIFDKSDMIYLTDCIFKQIFK